MLSKPNCGWVNIKIGDWCDRASYLTDPHKDLLNGFIQLYSERKPNVISCDAEGWEYLIVLDINNVHIIEYGEKTEFYTCEIDTKNLAQELIKDIEDNLDGWVHWDVEDDILVYERESLKEGYVGYCKEDYYNTAKIYLLQELDKLKEILSKY